MKQYFKKIRLNIYLCLALALSALFIAACAQSTENNNPITSAVVLDVQEIGSAKTFVLTGENFKFLMNGGVNPDIRVKLGDKIRIEFSSTQGFHDWVVDEFNAATEQVRPGTPTFVEFVADKKGTFEYYCSVGTHRAAGMKGNLIVE